MTKSRPPRPPRLPRTKDTILDQADNVLTDRELNILFLEVLLDIRDNLEIPYGEIDITE